MINKLINNLYSSIEYSINTSFSHISLTDEEKIQNNLYKQSILLVRKCIKRGIDISFSIIFLILSFPLFIIIAIAIKITSEGPVFFKQARVGYQGNHFIIWKFRTMQHENSEDDHQKYIQFMLKENYHLDNDDLLARYIAHVDQRTTFIGQLLRVTSLDELPQFINILMGKMSLVGPRPHPVYEVKEYKDWYKRRLYVKPGLTGWSKLNLRLTPVNYEEAILYDLWYVDHWSISLDLMIIFLTVPMILLMTDSH
jgi:lipopolysaccharide/colanic/teichoic acid biosynthesis glycosyltransferase